MKPENETKQKDQESTDSKPADNKRSTDQHFFYPEHSVTVVAKDREEADTKLEEILKGKQNG